MEQPLQQSSEPKDNEKEVEKYEEDDISYLSGKPFFDVVLGMSHVSPSYQLPIPARIVRELPQATVPVVLRYNCKNWNLSYMGNCSSPRLDSKWKNFVNDNNLKIGDACVFELMENSSSNIRFKVHILRGDLPPELRAKVDGRGQATENNPMQVD
ncbi:hypothetical protein CDL12_02090 [Handroanthus impetiginosus]|uniref:TF-B3 domain-containing protein n=1 Tax=Handroanthus impetiginosus TaxID=429701 RepID=A0A2G9I5V7_9LAMI|nr:hypothetical protein CDL12_02090 [Handroanthus impetiginosus]